jgi:hypothetical protein
MQKTSFSTKMARKTKEFLREGIPERKKVMMEMEASNVKDRSRHECKM